MKAVIKACEYYNHTGIIVERGKKYLAEISGKWTDLIYSCGPEGYSSPNFYMKWMEHLKRHTQAPWFALIATIDCKQLDFHLMPEIFTAKASGEIVCYANDVPFMYWNNFGSLTLNVSEITG
ncbi:MAG: hypothetical protein HQK79_20170 [Desulfobacterales bacterium]|nr:hypothetical protein [Desulfobacterales bacterium]